MLFLKTAKIFKGCEIFASELIRLTSREDRWCSFVDKKDNDFETSTGGRTHSLVFSAMYRPSVRGQFYYSDKPSAHISGMSIIVNALECAVTR